MMADPNLTAALQGTLEIASATDDAVSPLSEVTTDSVDELLERVNQHLVDGLPSRINDDELRRLVAIYRADAFRWSQEEQIKAAKTKGTGRKSIREAIEIEL